MIALAAAVAIVAGGLAAVVRYLVSLVFAGRGVLPLAVLVVNVVGSALAGTAVGLAHSGAISDTLRLVLLGGAAGGLTTFSTWSVETIQLMQEREWKRALLSVAANLVLGIGAAAAAYLLTTGG